LKFDHLDKTKDLAATPGELTILMNSNHEHCTRIRPGVLLAANRQSHTLAPACTRFRWRTPILY